MIKAYAIAKRIPLPYRHKMVAVVYRSGKHHGAPRCKDGRCPLGWLFADDNGAPSAGEIARRLKRFARNADVKLATLQDEAWEFIDAFDAGQLRGKGLRAALGLR